jgi:hypothetical protein
MGHRTVKRVPLDFDAPLNEVWEGYRSPTWRPCPSDDCDNGSTLAAAWLSRFAQLILLMAQAPERGLHPWLQELPVRPDKPPRENVAELTGGLAGRPPRLPFGHDACDQWSATSAIIKAAGLPEDWGTCPVCRGHAIHPDDIALSEAWEPTEPPEGDGWQLWETTSEGSPVSPVFETAEALAGWCEEGATPFGSMRWSASQWLASFRTETTDVDTLLVFRDGEQVAP